MKAATTLQVTKEMRIRVDLEMSVDEMDSLLEALRGVDRWPMHALKETLRQSLTAARAAYSSEHVIAL